MQPAHDMLTHVSGLTFGAAAVHLLRAGSPEEVAKFLGLVIGETVQKRSAVLDAIARDVQPSVLGLLLASNLAAIRGMLEIEPGQAFGPPMAWSELRDLLTAFRRDLDEVRAAFASSKSFASAAL